MTLLLLAALLSCPPTATGNKAAADDPACDVAEQDEAARAAHEEAFGR